MARENSKFQILCALLCALVAPSILLAQNGNHRSDEKPQPRILIYSDAHRDYEKIARMFKQAQGLDIDYVIGLGDLTEGRSLAEVARSYKFVAKQLWWLADAPFDRDLGVFQQSRRWIEFMGNKEEYGFLRIDRKNFGRQSRLIVSRMALVPDNKPDEGHVMNFNGFKIFFSHIPVSEVPKELRADQSEFNFRNVLWPPNWPLPFFPGPEPSTGSSMAKEHRPDDVDLVVYGHLHVAAKYTDSKTGTLVVSGGSASKNKSAEDQRAASYLIVDTRTREVMWYDIDDGKKYRQISLDHPKVRCGTMIQRVSRARPAEPPTGAIPPHRPIDVPHSP